MKRFVYAAFALFTAAAPAIAQPPPTQGESWLCSLEGTVEEISEVRETIRRKPDNVNYTPETKIEFPFTSVRLAVKSATPNPSSRWNVADCPQSGTVTKPIALCRQAAVTLGSALKAKLTTGNISELAGTYCLELMP